MAASVKHVRIGRPTLTKAGIRFPPGFWERVGKLFVADVNRRILAQQQADGTALEQNTTATLRRKAADNKPLLALVDENRALVTPAGYEITTGPTYVMIDLIPAYGVYVQQRGGRGGKGYRGWFGPSAAFAKAFVALARRVIKTGTVNA